MAPHELEALVTYGDVIREWVNSDRPLEKMRKSRWVVVPSQKATFLDPSGYRVQPQEKLNMELYNKEFWKACLAIHATGAKLDANLESRLTAHKESIQAFCDDESLEYKAPHGSWRKVTVGACSFYPEDEFRIAPPPNIERDVVVFYRDAYKSGPYEKCAGIDTRLLLPEGTSDKAQTIASLEKEFAGFKLLSITRVVIDPTNHNLLEHTTKLNNLAYAPF